MSRPADAVALGFKYREMSAEGKQGILERLRERLEDDEGIVFAYVYGGFVERVFFRDLDVAVWLRDHGRAFYYTVDFSARLEVELGIPLDLQVLNRAPLPFRHHVFARGRVLFSKDEGLRLKLMVDVDRQYIDLKKAAKASSR